MDFFFDPENVDLAWNRLSEAYLSLSLKWVTKIARAKASNRFNSVPILVFCGPAAVKTHVLQVGRSLLDFLDYQPQKCSRNRPQNVYYKLTKRGHLYENGPRFYALSMT